MHRGATAGYRSRLVASLAACAMAVFGAIAAARAESHAGTFDPTFMDLVRWGLPEGRVPDAAWGAIDEAWAQRREELAALESSAPPLAELASVLPRTSAAVASRRNEVERRVAAVDGIETRFDAALREALVHAGVEEEPALRLARDWTAHRLLRSLGPEIGGNLSIELPPVAPGADRAAIDEALDPHRVAVAAAAEAMRRSASIMRGLGAWPGQAIRSEDPEPLRSQLARLEADLEASRVRLGRAVGAAYAAALAAVDPADRAARRSALALRIDPTLASQHGSTRELLVAPRLRDLDEATRVRVELEAKELREQIDAARARAEDSRWSAIVRGDLAAASEGQEAWLDEGQALVDEARRRIADLLGTERTARLDAVVADWERLPAALPELIGPESAREVVAGADLASQFRLLGMRIFSNPSASLRWGNPARLSPDPGPAWRAGGAGGGAPHGMDPAACTAPVEELLRQHTGEWRSRVAPLAERHRLLLDRWSLPPWARRSSESDLPPELHHASLESLVAAAGELSTALVEVERAHAARIGARLGEPCPSRAVEWRLGRVMTVFAPRVAGVEGYHEGLVLPTPVDPLELLEATRSGPAERDLLLAAGAEALLRYGDALAERHGRLVRLALLTTWRGERLGHLIDRTAPPDRTYAAIDAAMLELLEQFDAHPVETERRWRRAWFELLAAWLELLPADAAERLRAAAARASYPSLARERRPVAETAAALARLVPADDPRRDVLLALPEAMRARLDETLLETIARLESAPRPADEVLIGANRGGFAERSALAGAFDRLALEEETRTLRDLIIVAGRDLARRVPSTRAMLEGVRWF